MRWIIIGIDAEARSGIIKMISCKDLAAIEYKVLYRSNNGVKIEERVKLFDELFGALKGEQISYNAVIAKCSRVITRADGEEISEGKEISPKGLLQS